MLIHPVINISFKWILSKSQGHLPNLCSFFIVELTGVELSSVQYSLVTEIRVEWSRKKFCDREFQCNRNISIKTLKNKECSLINSSI